MRLPQAGGCACHAARYELKGSPLLVYACHCHDCQSRSGSAFTLNMVILTADLALSAGFGTRRRKRRDGPEIEYGYCHACEGQVWARALAAPTYATLLAGTLDDAGWVRPVAQTFVESAIPWAVIPGVRTVAWPDFDYEALGRAWSASAPEFVA